MADRPPRTSRPKMLWVVLGSIAGILLILGGTVAWLLGTSSGLSTLLGLGARFGLPQITAQGLEGSALGPIDAKNLHIEGPGYAITLVNLHMAWTPEALRNGRVEVQDLVASRLIVETSGANNEPLQLPADLRLPYAVDVAHLRVGVVEHVVKGTGQSSIVARDLEASFASDGAHHKLSNLSVRAAGVSVQGNAQLTGVRPFAVNAALDVQGIDATPPWRAHVTAAGVLERLQVSATGSGQGFEGTGEATLRPFAPVWIEHLVARIPRLDVQQ
ncbi:MAG: hypothetical protein M3Z31_15985, partial [Pseudomonadota bacterium]|nr:hypothetical protein [Pseudomonadota bacterium]